MRKGVGAGGAFLIQTKRAASPRHRHFFLYFFIYLFKGGFPLLHVRPCITGLLNPFVSSSQVTPFFFFFALESSILSPTPEPLRLARLRVIRVRLGSPQFSSVICFGNSPLLPLSPLFPSSGVCGANSAPRTFRCDSCSGPYALCWLGRYTRRRE